MLRAVWNDDMTTLKRLFREMGFGTDGMEMPADEVVREYHSIILEPLAHRRPFRFSEFEVHGRVRDFFKRNLGFLKLVPPADLLMYFRVIAGLKGMMTLADAAVDLRSIAESACERRGI